MSTHLVVFHQKWPVWEICDPTYLPDGSLQSAWVVNGNWFLQRHEGDMFSSAEAPGGRPRGLFRAEDLTVETIECEGDPIAAWFK